MAKTRYKAKDVIEAIEQVGAVKTKIANYLGCHRNTVTNYIERYVTVKQAYEDERGAIGDAIESKGFALAMEGDVRLIRFFLSTLFKHRGYSSAPSTQVSVEQTTVVEETFELDLSGLTDEELALLDKLIEKIEASGQS